ncbi:MAG: hypothetical protein BWY95_02738 [Bacteroidetes bacterium ADurb.BinA104]|nr:MAG: hypothetical protein BWY95_02738 [Bacteroidetes bacterium ADurb.BinA104]
MYLLPAGFILSLHFTSMLFNPMLPYPSPTTAITSPSVSISSLNSDHSVSIPTAFLLFTLYLYTVSSLNPVFFIPCVPPHTPYVCHTAMPVKSPLLPTYFPAVSLYMLYSVYTGFFVSLDNITTTLFFVAFLTIALPGTSAFVYVLIYPVYTVSSPSPLRDCARR